MRIDASIMIPKLVNLVELNLSSCGLTQLPSGLGQCCQLQTLSFSYNPMLANNSIYIPKLEQLKKLNLSSCKLQQLPSGLDECLELQDLYVSGNNLGENVLTVVDLPKLTTLICDNGEFSRGEGGKTY